MDSQAKAQYLSVLRACNSLVDSVGRNLWAKFVPAPDFGGDTLDVELNIEAGNDTPRRVMLCLARQVHNFKCVAKILERVRDAEKFIADVEIETESANPFHVNLELLSSLNSRVTMLEKCETAMQRRHSVRHRVANVSASAGVSCFVLCDIDCSILGLQLSQTDSLTLKSNKDPQCWTVEDRAGRRLRVPPLFLGIEAKSGELARIRKVKAAAMASVHSIHSQLAAQLMLATGKLQTCSDGLMLLLQCEQEASAFIYKLKILDKYLRILSKVNDSSLNEQDFSVLQESISYVLGRIEEGVVPQAVISSPIGPELVKLRTGLHSLRQLARSQEAAQRSRRRQSQQKQHYGSIGSFRSSRSHRLSEPKRRTSMLKFDFEFLESTQRVCSTRRTQPASDSLSASSISSSKSGRTHQNEVVTRQRQQVQRKFVIKSVWDGQRHVSLDEAAQLGLVNFARGVYRDPASGRDLPLQAAMAAGKVSVEFTSTKKLSEDSSSFGLIQLEEPHEEVGSVLLADSGGRWLPAEEAAAAGLVDEKLQRVLAPAGGDTATPEWLSCGEAQRRGLATLRQRQRQVSYVVHAVVDVKAKSRVSFQEAAQLGLLDRETGQFRNSLTEQLLPPEEAIRLGFLKAYAVDDPKKLDIEPENRITAARFHSLKNRFHAVNAFTKGLKTKQN